MAEYSRIATGAVTSTGGQTAVVIPFIPNYIEITNTTEITANSGGVTKAWWYSDMGQGAAAYITTTSGTDASNFISASTGGGFTTIKAGLALQYGATIALGGSGAITKSSTIPEIITTAAHGLTTGDWVVFQNLYQTATTGMQQMAGIPFMVTVIDTTHFTIQYNNNLSNYTAITAGGYNTLPSFKQILYPVLYAPGVSFVWKVTTGTTTTVYTTVPHNFVAGQEIAFRIPPQWGMTQLNSLPNTALPGQPIYGYVTSVVNSTEFICSINSTNFTAFTTNLVFASFPGETFAQVVAVGDVNTGGWPYNGGALYPSPQFFNGFTASTTTGVSTINGPAIYGAFCTATFQGFIIGTTISGTVSDQLYWTAILSDINL